MVGFRVTAEGGREVYRDGERVIEVCAVAEAKKFLKTACSIRDLAGGGALSVGGTGGQRLEGERLPFYR